jgi:type IV pilus assembly protein PilM
MFAHETRTVVGLDMGSTSVKLVELSGHPGTFRLENLALAVIEAPRDEAAVLAAVRSARDACGEGGRRAVGSVSGPHVAVRSFHFPRMAEKDVKGAIWYEGSQVIAFDIADSYVDYTAMEVTPDSRTMNVLFVAAMKAEVDSKVQLMKSCGFDPRSIGVDALVLLEALLAAEEQSAATLAIMDVGARTTSIGIARRGMVPFMRDVDIAGDTYTRAIGELLGIDQKEAEKVKMTEAITNPAVSQAAGGVTRHLVGEVSRSIAYYKSRDDGSEVDRIYLCGGGSGFPNLPEVLEEVTGIRVLPWSPLELVEIDESRFDKATVDHLAPFVSLAAALAMVEGVH